MSALTWLFEAFVRAGVWVYLVLVLSQPLVLVIALPEGVRSLPWIEATRWCVGLSLVGMIIMAVTAGIILSPWLIMSLAYYS